MERDDGVRGLFFLSGDWVSLDTGEWAQQQFPARAAAFNLHSRAGRPIVLGTARQNASIALYGETSHLKECAHQIITIF